MKRDHGRQLYDLYKSRNEHQSRIPASLLKFVDGSVIKILAQAPPQLSPEREKTRVELVVSASLRELSIDHELGHSLQWVDEHGITIRQTFWRPGELSDLLCIEQIIHEIGHFLETSDERASQQDWGLKWPKDYRKSAQLGPKGFMSEFRASAYDLALRRMLGIEIPKNHFNMMRPVVYAVMNASNKGDVRKLPEVASSQILGPSTDDIIINFTNELATSFTDDIIMKEWNRKNEIVRSHLSQLQHAG